MKNTRALLLTLLISESVFASRTNMVPGSGSTLGPGSNEYSLFSGRFNPAMGMLMVRDSEHWRLGYLPTIATSVELGDVDNFSDELQDLIDIIDDPSLAKDSVNVTLDRFNKLLVSMGQEGYAKNTTGVYFPLFYRDDIFGGTLNIDLNYEIQAAARILDDPLSFDNQNISFATNTSIYLKSGIEKTLSFSYSHQLFESNAFLSANGKLYGGMRISFVNLDLSKQVIWLEGVNNNDLSDIIRDQYDKDLTSNRQLSIDAGIVFDADVYRLGLTLTNINSPQFNYNSVGTACDTKPSNSIEQDNCYVAQYFIEHKQTLKAKEIHKKNMLATVDATYKMSEKWRLMGSYDLAAYNDVVGFENKMLNIGMSYETSGYWPSPRIGYQSNLADKGLSSMSIGFTFFKCITLDIAESSQKTTIDGTTVPRYLSFSLGFEEKF